MNETIYMNEGGVLKTISNEDKMRQAYYDLEREITRREVERILFVRTCTEQSYKIGKLHDRIAKFNSLPWYKRIFHTV